jgi:hypothetical protein
MWLVVSKSMQAPLKTRLILRKIAKILGVQQGIWNFSKGAIWAAYLAGAVCSIHNWSVAQGGLCVYAFILEQ